MIFAEKERGAEFRDIYRGDFAKHRPDWTNSEAVASFLRKAAFYSNNDPEQMERLIRGSGLSSEKFDESRGASTWLGVEIIKASDGTPETYSEKRFSSSRNATPLTSPPHSTHSTHRLEPITAKDLLSVEYPATRWVIADVLPEGVTLLVGKPKKGKSWLALDICEAIASGGVAFGTKRVEQGDTLYLALEDNHKRLQKRLKKVLDGRDAPERMHLHVEWPRLADGGAQKLDEWLTEHPETRLVVIDTLTKIRNPARGHNVYAEDYAALEALLPISAEHGVAIVVVYHLRKAAAADPLDEISSSTGLTAGVDGFMILRRTPGSKGPTLYIDGRDIEEPTEYALHWNVNTATWTIEGEAEEVHRSKERADILLVLNRSKEPLTPKEVWEDLPHTKRENIRSLLRSMLEAGEVVSQEKGYYSPAQRTNPPFPSPSFKKPPRNPGGSEELLICECCEWGVSDPLTAPLCLNPLIYAGNKAPCECCEPSASKLFINRRKRSISQNSPSLDRER